MTLPLIPPEPVPFSVKPLHPQKGSFVFGLIWVPEKQRLYITALLVWFRIQFPYTPETVIDNRNKEIKSVPYSPNLNIEVVSITRRSEDENND